MHRIGKSKNPRKDVSSFHVLSASLVGWPEELARYVPTIPTTDAAEALLMNA